MPLEQAIKRENAIASQLTDYLYYPTREFLNKFLDDDTGEQSFFGDVNGREFFLARRAGYAIPEIREKVEGRFKLIWSPSSLLHPLNSAEAVSLRLGPKGKSLAAILRFPNSISEGLFIINLESQSDPEFVSSAVRSVEWGEDETKIFYTTLERSLPNKLFLFDMNFNKTRLLAETQDQLTALTISRGAFGKHIFVTKDNVTEQSVWDVSVSRTSSEKASLIELLPFKEASVWARAWGDEISLFASEADKFSVTSRGPDATQEKKVVFDLHDEAWSNLGIIDADRIAGSAIIFLQKRGKPLLRIVNIHDGSFRDIIPNLNVGSCKRIPNQDQNEPYKIACSSFLRPPEIYKITEGILTLKKDLTTHQTDPSVNDLVEEYLSVPSVDGQETGISLVRPKKIPGPIVLHVYGASGVPMMATYDRERLELLKQGIGYAIAHVRGGGERGERWKRDGFKEGKKGGVEDLLSIIQYLETSGVTTKEQLVLETRSAGGLILGPLIDRVPNLMNAAIFEYPVVKVTSKKLLNRSDLANRDIREWGEQNLFPEDVDLRSFPSAQPDTRTSPTVFTTAELNDPLVPITELLDWIHNIRCRNRDPGIAVMLISNGGDHWGAHVRATDLNQRAIIAAFAASSR